MCIPKIMPMISICLIGVLATNIRSQEHQIDNTKPEYRIAFEAWFIEIDQEMNQEWFGNPEPTANAGINNRNLAVPSYGGYPPCDFEILSDIENFFLLKTGEITTPAFKIKPLPNEQGIKFAYLPTRLSVTTDKKLPVVVTKNKCSFSSFKFG